MKIVANLRRQVFTVIGFLFALSATLPIKVFAVGPIDIHTCEDLQAINDNLTADYRLANNIDCSETSTWNGGEGFVPIGNDSTLFEGTLDGNYKIISNLTINVPGSSSVGMFSYVDDTAEISNLRLANVDIVGDEDVGGLAGTLYGTASNINVSGVVYGHYDVGGLVGAHSVSGAAHAIANSSSSVHVNSDTGYAGGLVGWNNASNITNSFTTGDVYIGSGNAGGLVGYSSSATITGSFATGSVSSDPEVSSNSIGGLIGFSSEDIISNSFAIGDVTTASNNVGGLIGEVFNSEVSNVFATGEVTGVISVGGLIGNIYGSLAVLNNSYATGNVTSSITDGCLVGGLIGYVGAGANIDHVYATGNVDLQDGDLTLGGAGGLIGQYVASNNTLSSAYANGIVTSNAKNVGGLIGIVNGGSNGVIDQVFATGNVSAPYIAGGLIGQVSDMIDVTNVYATGSVTAQWGQSGLIGQVIIPDDNNPVSITNAFTTGAVPYDVETDHGGVIGTAGVWGGGTSAINLTNVFWDTESSGMPEVDNLSGYGISKTTAEMKNIRTFVDQGFNLTLGDPAYDFTGTQYDDSATNDVWEINGTTNNGYPYFNAALSFDFSAFVNKDADSSLDSAETASPNNGDANNDGTQDDRQPNITSFDNSVSGVTSVLEVNNDCFIHIVDDSAESAQAIADSGYSYPAGLMNFIAECSTPGSTITVTQYYYGLSSSGIIARKYNKLTSGYQTIGGATISQITIAGQTVTKVSYQITDGGLLDEDGVVNGLIVDPSGPGISEVGAPNTGLQRLNQGLSL